jgi:hypothetical protein
MSPTLVNGDTPEWGANRLQTKKDDTRFTSLPLGSAPPPHLQNNQCSEQKANILSSPKWTKVESACRAIRGGNPSGASPEDRRRSFRFQAEPEDRVAGCRCGTGDSIRGIRNTSQFTAAPPQHRLYFFPEPHGHGSFRPTLGAVCRGSLRWSPASACRCDRK